MDNRNKSLTRRLEKIARYYRKLNEISVKEDTENVMTDSKKSPIRTWTQMLDDGYNRQNPVVNDNNCHPSPFGLINGVVPQRNIEGQYSDSRPYYKITSDEQNDNMGWRNPC